MKKFITITLIMVMLFCFTACSGDYQEALDPQSEEYITYEIPMGSTATAIAETLQELGIIADSKNFKDYLKKNEYDSRLQAGTYVLSPNMDYDNIVDVLVNGKVATKTFTIPEGLTNRQVCQKLEDQGLGDYNTFLSLITEMNFDCPWLSIAKENSYDPLEGYILPNTYTVSINYDEKDIMNFLFEQYKNYVLPMTGDMNVSDFNDLIIKASVIEREAKVDSERALVASVIENRLAKGMMLQMDCTINYLFLQEEGQVHENLLYRDLEWDSPYNTYKYYGLPAAPICNPGLKSIEAAMHPAETDYLYYVVSGELDGHHNFSNNYSDFSKFVAEYDKAVSGN